MPYVENRTVHDADTHIMELPDCLDAFIEPQYRERLLTHIHGAKRAGSPTPLGPTRRSSSTATRSFGRTPTPTS